MDAVAKIEKALGPGKFTYYYYRDFGSTGRFEVNVYPNSTIDEGFGILVHSRKQSHKYPHDNYEMFIHQIV